MIRFHYFLLFFSSCWWLFTWRVVCEQKYKGTVKCTYATSTGHSQEQEEMNKIAAHSYVQRLGKRVSNS